MHQLARFGIILLGLYAITHGFISSGRITATFLETIGPTVPTSQIMVAIVGVIVLLGFVPGVLLIAVNRRIATAIFSSEEVGSLKLNDVEGLHVVGFSLLGVYFLIYGLFGTLSASVSLLGSLHLLGFSDAAVVPRGIPAAVVGRLVASLVESIAGISLFLGAKRLAHTFSLGRD